MTIRFMLAVLLCFAFVSVGLLNPTWYFVLSVQAAAFFSYLYAGFGALDSRVRQKQAWFAFWFTGLFYLAFPNTLSWSVTGQFVNELRNALHSQESSSASVVLFDDWIGWFESIAVVGVSLTLSLVMFVTVSVLTRIQRRQNGPGELDSKGSQ